MLIMDRPNYFSSPC